MVTTGNFSKPANSGIAAPGSNPPFAGHGMASNATWEIEGEDTPTVTLEAGWSESYTKLRRDLNFWMTGAPSPIKLDW